MALPCLDIRLGPRSGANRVRSLREPVWTDPSKEPYGYACCINVARIEQRGYALCVATIRGLGASTEIIVYERRKRQAGPNIQLVLPATSSRSTTIISFQHHNVLREPSCTPTDLPALGT